MGNAEEPQKTRLRNIVQGWGKREGKGIERMRKKDVTPKSQERKGDREASKAASRSMTGT